jgi:hypothetical protein
MTDNWTVSHSRLKTFRRCFKKHDFKYNQGLRKKRKAAPLWRGSLIHEMIDARVFNLINPHSKTKKDPYAVTRKAAKEFRQLLREEVEEYGETFIEDIDRVFRGYERTYADEKLVYVESEVERRIELLNGVEFIYIIDKIAEDKNRRWLMDHKTAKSIPGEEGRFSDLQLVFYTWAEAERGEPVDGIIWDYIRTKAPSIPEQLKNGGLSQAKNQSTDYHTYYGELRRLGLDERPYREFLEKLKKRGSSDFFQRISLPTPSKDVIKSVVRDARETTRQIMEDGEKLKARNMTRDCSWDCEFYQLCHAEMRGLDAEFVKKTKYEVRNGEESDESKHS